MRQRADNTNHLLVIMAKVAGGMPMKAVAAQYGCSTQNVSHMVSRYGVRINRGRRPELQTQAVAMLARGSRIRDVADALGVGLSTVKAWSARLRRMETTRLRHGWAERRAWLKQGGRRA